ncbi:G protein-coupled receptor 141 [Stigmatopora nigra]
MDSTPINTNSTVTTPAQNKSMGKADFEEKEYHTLLTIIYTAVLIIGTASFSITLYFMKLRTSSSTSIAVINLIFAHLIFLLTVPFRIYYHVTGHWRIGMAFCKVVSSMVHIHMYISFGIYVVILITRLLVFYRNSEQLASPRRIYPQVASAVVWLIVLTIVTCIITLTYGNSNKERETVYNHQQCFKFGNDLNHISRVINYVVSTLFITVAILLTGLQANVLWLLYRKHHQCCTVQQEFGAQQKSLNFALIMVVCFIPYHIFRLYYLQHPELQNLNEVFLSLTTFNCVDMLTFFGRRTLLVCFPGKAI